MNRKHLWGNAVHWIGAFLAFLIVGIFVIYTIKTVQNEDPTPTQPPISRDGGLPGGDDPPLDPPPLDPPPGRDPEPGPTAAAPPPESRKPRLRTAWILENGTKARQKPGLNMEVVNTFNQGDEVFWVKDQLNWDLVEDQKGNPMWVESRSLTFIRPTNLNAPSVAERQVMDFYARVARKDYSEAYRHLSPEWKKELSYQRFEEGYSRTLSLRSEVSNVIELGPDRFQVDITQVADEDGADVDYLGSYTVEKIDGRFMMTSGLLRRLKPR